MTPEELDAIAAVARRLAAPVEPVEEADAYAVRAEKAEAALDRVQALCGDASFGQVEITDIRAVIEGES